MSTNKQPVYPKDTGSKERARQDFLQKVSKWRWEDPDECPYKKRGRKPKNPKNFVRPESRARTKGEAEAQRQGKYTWLK